MAKIIFVLTWTTKFLFSVLAKKKSGGFLRSERSGNEDHCCAKPGARLSKYGGRFVYVFIDRYFTINSTFLCHDKGYPTTAY